MPKIRIITWTEDGDDMTLWQGLYPVVPRKKELIRLTGLQFGTRKEPTTDFVVVDILHDIDATIPDDAVQEIEVHVAFANESLPSFEPRCTCSSRSLTTTDGCCDNCGDRID